jgi:hypothetical protein
MESKTMAKAAKKTKAKRPIADRAPWSRTDVRRIQSGYKANEPVRWIASALGRSESAVRQKACAEGIRRPGRKRPTPKPTAAQKRSQHALRRGRAAAVAPAT